MIDLQEALRLAVEKTGHARFRDLLDPGYPDYQPAYETVVRALAEGRDPVPAVAEFVAVAVRAQEPAVSTMPGFDMGAIARFKPLATHCLYAAHSGWRSCGCRGCWAKGDRNTPKEVSQRECLECVAALVRRDG